MQPRGALAVPWLKWLKVFVSSLRILPFKTRGEEIKLGHDFVKTHLFGKKISTSFLTKVRGYQRWMYSKDFQWKIFQDWPAVQATHPEEVKVLIDLSSEDARPMWVVNTHFSHRSLTQNRRFVIFYVAKSYSNHTYKLSKTDVEEGPVGIWMCFRDAWRL